LEDAVRKCFIAEVDTYCAYVSGDVYGYVIDDDGDSCWSFYRLSDAVEFAKNAVDYLPEQLQLFG
jgi:hypothetical protein